MSALRSGAMVLGYKQEEYIAYCLRALAPCADEVVVLYSDVPFAKYNSRAREQFIGKDATGAILRELRQEFANLHVVPGIWDDEPAARSAALQLLRERGVELCLCVDADEIYPEGVLRRIRERVEAAEAPGSVYYAAYHTCYKRFDHVVESDHRLPVATHLTPDTRFELRPRRPTGPRRDLPADLAFWHMGYVLSDERMWEKINTFSHAHQILPNWYRDKWLGWTPRTRDLARKHPASRWPRTRRIDPRTLPAELHAHPFFPKGEHAG